MKLKLRKRGQRHEEDEETDAYGTDGRHGDVHHGPEYGRGGGEEVRHRIRVHEEAGTEEVRPAQGKVREEERDQEGEV